ncbi:alpha box protein [Leptodontidium sp. MPI-SDFR-AT-0119]|nr:alpha box protein [Leptodontidium sp. MPI-SDFR-AT-0119]
MNYPLRSQEHAATAIRWQQQHPQLFYQQLRLRTHHIARRPVLPKKSLNSWMAFRCRSLSPTASAVANLRIAFYQSLFPHLQQKEASVYLTALWKRDPFKAKWTIIAAAYSKIRNTVGKPRAPLDQYLNIICPQMGIIAVDAYLEVFNWICDETPEGSLLFHQTTAPELHTFDQHILHSSMTEKDLVLFCGSTGYIRQSVARRIAEARTNHRMPQHGLLASAPINDTPDIQATSSSSPEAVSRESGFEVPSTTPTQAAAESYEWTGSMSDLYHPSEGSIDFDRLVRSYHSNPWDTTNIDDPKALDTFVENGGMQDGYLVPIGM